MGFKTRHGNFRISLKPHVLKLVSNYLKLLWTAILLLFEPFLYDKGNCHEYMPYRLTISIKSTK